MAEKSSSINQILARNLAYWMGQAKLTQRALAEKASVNQKTISNYLNPDQRSKGATGKEPSAKLTELERIAGALGVSVWQLVREMSPSERAMYESIERAYQDLKAAAEQPPPVTAAELALDALHGPRLKTFDVPLEKKISATTTTAPRHGKKNS